MHIVSADLFCTLGMCVCVYYDDGMARTTTAKTEITT